jgi:preprotein translocase subunit SecG
MGGGGDQPSVSSSTTEVNQMVVLTVLLAILWVAVAFWPARVAGRKGHSFFGFFLLSILFFPLALILAYVAEDRTAVVLV